MSEYIGCQISLISKSEIRYVGILHQIDSDSATVALKEVRSYGTEGRKSSANPPGDEVPASDHVYEYIVFRGNDVAHLNIIQRPDENQPPRPQIPDDPAIIGTDRPSYQQPPPPPPQQQQQQQWQQQQQQQQYPPQQNLQPQYPPYGYPQQAPRFAGPGGPHGFPGAPGAVHGYGMPSYNGPTGGNWYQGPPDQFPPGPPGQSQEQRPFTPHGAPGPQATGPSPLNNMQQSQNGEAAGQAPIGGQGDQQRQQPQQASSKNSESVQEPRATELSATPTRLSANAATARKVDDAPRAQNRAPGTQGNRDSRVALPKAPVGNSFASIAANPDVPSNQSAAPQQVRSSTATAPAQPAANAARDNQDVTSRAAAAVAAAMAKLGPTPGQIGASSTRAMDDITRKINDTRITSDTRGGRQQTHNHHSGAYGSQRGGPRRGGGPRHNGAPIEIPTNDFDFETANAKLNKSDIMKEATASSSDPKTPGTEQTMSTDTAALAPVPIPAAGSTYDKKSSFFDNISSDLKDRTEDAAAASAGTGSGAGRGGSNTRYAQRKQNLETFGQANVDGGAGHHRDHGRGRGRGGFGRGPRGGHQRFDARSNATPGQTQT